MADHQYLSIGEVLGLLLEDFPDVTISKIRFLESQGLIEPERTPSGYRKFYDNDVELLRAILHEQKANFLPLKVIRDRIESGAIDSDSTGGRTPPRGIRNVEPQPARDEAEGRPHDDEARDSVFRRTDGGPEWAGGRALIPGRRDADLLGAPVDVSNSPITTVVAVIPGTPSMSPTTAGGDVKTAPPTTVEPVQNPDAGHDPRRRAEKPSTAGTVIASLIEPLPRPDRAVDPEPTGGVDSKQPAPSESVASPPALVLTSDEPRPAGAATPDKPTAADLTRPRGPAAAAAPAPSPTASSPSAPSPSVAEPSAPKGASDGARELPYNSDELCEAASITSTQLAALQDYGIITSRGSGVDTSFPPAAVEIARIAGQLLGQGIDARHLRAWRQAAERESALFEQRIMPLLRQRNPQARQSALDSLSNLSGLGARLHDALVDSMLQHHFDGM